jgi:UDP-N-acetylglucosamine 2-epimerase (non-hydrolysing)
LIRTLFIFGTRPEAIKLCPIILDQQSRPDEFDPKICVTAQHRHLIDQVLPVFGIAATHDLNLMLPAQTLFQSTSRILGNLESVISSESPDLIIVQGDTTSTFCGALAGFYSDVPVAHVEAGLRTDDRRQPFPEEMNRVLTTSLATLHFCATEGARRNLLAENVDPAHVYVTGNSGIDAVLYVRDGLEAGRLKNANKIAIDSSKKLVLVTAHRRESFGAELESICRALGTLASRCDTQIVFPVHPNPNVQDPVERLLGARPNVLLLDPQPYVSFVDLMRKAYLLLTDSGGIQEEGPSLGKPILVMREKTERPEAVEAGTVKLVGTSESRIYEAASRLLEDRAEYECMARVHNPYGDGCASGRISEHILTYFGASCRQQPDAARVTSA